MSASKRLIASLRNVALGSTPGVAAYLLYGAGPALSVQPFGIIADERPRIDYIEPVAGKIGSEPKPIARHYNRQGAGNVTVAEDAPEIGEAPFLIFIGESGIEAISTCGRYGDP